MILAIISVVTCFVVGLFSCLVAASRYDDMMGYDDVREEDDRNESTIQP